MSPTDRDDAPLSADSAQAPPADLVTALMPVLRTLWELRRTIAVVVGAVMVIFVLVSLVASLALPSEHFSSLGFRLLFEGADAGKYPNGASFSTAEVIETPVLSEVYAKDDLKTYISYDDFKRALFILQSNPAVDLLNLEYASKLSDSKLTPTDRSRLEMEYAKKLEVIKDPLYSLNYRRTEKSSLPASLQAKVLSDVLATWAQQAQDQKGVYSYRIAILSKNIIRGDFINALDYGIAVDILHSRIQVIQSGIKELLVLPGAPTMRTGKERVSLPEIALNLNDIDRYTLQPLLVTIRDEGLSRDPVALREYYAGRLRQLQIQEDEIVQRTRSTESALREYMRQQSEFPIPSGSTSNRGPGAFESPSTIAQFGDSFLDRIVQLGKANDDVKYRQGIADELILDGKSASRLDTDIAYYSDMAKSLPVSSHANISPSVAAHVQAQADTAMAQISTALDQIGAIFQDLGTYNLNPSTFLYAITTPFSSRIEAALPLRTVALYGLLVFLISLIVVPTGCLAYDYLRRQLKTRVKNVAGPR